MRSISLIIRGLSALVATVALVAGVPAALAAGVGWPLPRVLPAWSEISATINGSVPLDPQLVWNVLAVAVWVAWAQLVTALVVESVALVRGAMAGPVAGLGAMQRLAASPARVDDDAGSQHQPRGGGSHRPDRGCCRTCPHRRGRAPGTPWRTFESGERGVS
ncbi:MAG: hypothetical protein JJE52_09105 [Acidimicrobiia bacterium]|nr:hypothetical protein [Acidimicrobiia bacterium]